MRTTRAWWTGVMALAGVVGALGLGLVGCGGNEATGSSESGQSGDDPAAEGAAGAGVGTDGQSAATAMQREFTVRDVSFRVPEPWTPEPPSNAMRAAQFRIDPPPGVDASVGVGAVFTSIGGGVEDNLARWEEQYVVEADRSIERELRTVNGRSVAVFRASGTFDEGRMLGSTGPKEEFMTLGFLVEMNSDRPLIVKITGPSATLTPALGVWREMVDSISVVE